MEATDDLSRAAERLLIQPEKPAEADTDAGPQLDATDQEEAEAGDEAAEGEADQDTPEEDDEADEVEASDEDDDGSDDEESDGDEQPKTFTVKVNGEEVRVTLEDLTRSYSGQEYIRRGMEEAATKRKEAEQLFFTLQEQRARFVETVQALQLQGMKAPPKAPDPKLIDTDPIGYMQKQAEFQREMQEYQSQQAQIQMVRQQQDEAQRMAFAKHLEDQRAQMVRLVPELGDAKMAPEFQKKLAAVGTERYGLTQEELAGISDARYVQILADAMRWQDLQRSKGEAKKPKPKPKNVKPVGRRKPPEVVQRQKAKEQARRSGKLEDWASLLLTNGKP